MSVRRVVTYPLPARIVFAMPRPTTGREIVSVRLDPDDLAWLDAEAGRRGVSRAETLRLLVAAQRRSTTVDAKIGIRAPVVTGLSATPNRTAVGAGSSRHAFKPQKHNGLRCEHCGQRKAAH